jgi:hypothetical protein
MAVMTFEEALAAWLPQRRWFAGKGTPITSLAVPPITPRSSAATLALRHSSST